MGKSPIFAHLCVHLMWFFMPHWWLNRSDDQIFSCPNGWMDELKDWGREGGAASGFQHMRNLLDSSSRWCVCRTDENSIFRICVDESSSNLLLYHRVDTIQSDGFKSMTKSSVHSNGTANSIVDFFTALCLEEVNKPLANPSFLWIWKHQQDASRTPVVALVIYDLSNQLVAMITTNPKQAIFYGTLGKNKEETRNG